MKRITSNLILIAASTALFFACLELALALFWPHKIGDHPFYHEQYHPVIGWVNEPNVDGDYNLTRRTTYHRHHNEKGLRALSEIPYEKRPGVKRVLLLGDSFFWGYGVNDEDVISEVLQQQTGPDIEIVNGAAPGYGTDQELLWLTEEGFKYRPDLVVLGFYAANDWQEISRSVSYGYPGYPKPFFELSNGQLIATNIPVPDTRETRREAFHEPVTLFEKLKASLRHHTHTYPFIAARLNSVPVLRNTFLAAGIANDFTPAFHDVPIRTHRMNDILPISEALIRKIRSVSKELRAEFLLVFIPEKEYTPGAPPIYEGILAGAESRNSEASRYLARFSASQKIHYLDLLPKTRERQSNGDILYVPQRYDHHWTPAGHRSAAGALGAWIQNNGFDPSLN